MVVQTYSSSKHHVILISKRRIRVLSILLLGAVATLFLAHSSSLFVTKTAVFQLQIDDDADEPIAEVGAAIVGSYRHQHRKSVQNDEPTADEALFQGTRLEDLTCIDAKTSGKCMFETRHLPPRFSFLESTTKNQTQEEKRNRNEALNFFSKMSNGVALVVTFNKATNYEVAPLIESYYRGVFVEIIFCGPSTPSEQFRLIIEQYHGPELADRMKKQFISYQPDLPDFGENVYMCFNLALSNERLLGRLFEHGSLRGVLVMADDVLLNYWNLFHALPYPSAKVSNNNNNSETTSNILTGELFDLDKSHAMDVGVIYDTVSLNACLPIDAPCNLPNTWPNWPKMFQVETRAFYSALENLAHEYSGNAVWSDCWRRIIDRTGGSGRVLQSPSDVFYIARQHFATAMAMFELASRHKVFQEVAVQTTFSCFPDATRLRLDGAGINTDGINRKMPWAGYRTDWLFMHPFKLSLVVSQDVRVRNFYLADRCLYCMLAEFSKQFRFSVAKHINHLETSSPASSSSSSLAMTQPSNSTVTA